MYRAFGEVVALDPAAAEEELGVYRAKFTAATSALPEAPDAAPIEEWLLKVRRVFFP
jgi:hypothetical protein